MQSLAAESVDKPSDVTAYGYELRTLAEDVYLLTYRAVRKREGTAALHSLRSSIWTFIDGRWNAIPLGDVRALIARFDMPRSKTAAIMPGMARQLLANVSRSALICSALVVGIPCGRPG